MAKDIITFDTTDAGTISDSDKILSGIISSDGSTLITDTLSGGKQGLDVYLINAGDIQVESNAEKAEDSAHVSGDVGNFVLGIRQDVLGSSTDADGDYAAFKQNEKGEQYVIDTDGNALLTTIDSVLDAIAVDIAAIEIEQLAQGIVLDAIAADTAAMVVDLAAIEVEQLAQGITLDGILVDTGSIDSSITALSKAEDSVHVSGDQGIMSLAVRNDAGTALAGDGDYIPFSTDATGALRVVDASGGTDEALANTALAHSAVAVDTTAGGTDLVGTDLANRKYLNVYNGGNRKIYLGNSGVTSVNGFPVSPGSYLEMRAGASIDIHAISASGTQDIRILELS
jgi:hypothetical protein